MTAIVSANQMRTESPIEPFCDKQFKFLRVMSSSLSQYCLATFLRVISLVSGLFSRNLSEYYESLALYHTIKAKGQWRVYRGNQNQSKGAYFDSTSNKFGGRIIDFSFNLSTRVKEYLRAGFTEKDELNRIYGKESVDRRCRVLSPAIPLNRDRLTRLDVSEGCCFGMSIHFISEYFRALKKRMTANEAIKSIAPSYNSGAPDEAQLIQIVYNALDNRDMVQQIRQHPEEYGNPKRVEDLIQLKKIGIELSYMSQNEQESDPKFKELKLKSKQLSEKIHNDEVKGYRVLWKRLEGSRIKPFARPLGIKMDLMTASITKSSRLEKFEMNNQFNDFFNQLPVGVYLVDTFQEYSVFRDDPPAKHALVLIKTREGNDYIFDPNYATFSVEKKRSAAQLWNLCTEFYLKNGFFSLNFTRCQQL